MRWHFSSPLAHSSPFENLLQIAQSASECERVFGDREVDFELRAMTQSEEGTGQTKTTPLVLEREPEELAM